MRNTSPGNGEYSIMALPARFAETPYLHGFLLPEKVRDTLYREDQSQARTGSGPRAMATLRNLAIGGLHLAGRHDITEATRWTSRYMDRPFTIPGLTS